MFLTVGGTPLEALSCQAVACTVCASFNASEDAGCLLVLWQVLHCWSNCRQQLWYRGLTAGHDVEGLFMHTCAVMDAGVVSSHNRAVGAMNF